MSLEIFAYPTVSALATALDNQSAGFSLQGRYIGIGTGLQSIALDNDGMAITDQLIAPVAWLEILSAKRLGNNQWQLTVDVAGTNAGVEYNLGEIALSGASTVGTANNHVIAIYSNASQSLMTVSPQVDSALISINLLLSTLPSDSVEIIHSDQPLELSIAPQMIAIMQGMGEMHSNARELVAQRQSIAAQQVQINALLFESTD